VQPKGGSSLFVETKYPFKDANNKFPLHPAGFGDGNKHFGNRKGSSIEYINNTKKSKKKNSSILGIILKDSCGHTIQKQRLI